ncbi:MAG: dTMP kinase [Patescibacteria group bacterium]|nr:dTMP kinase [bacterium]MDZ4241013.1 dTMP kinase [Patescibacteria group bacterium]
MKKGKFIVFEGGEGSGKDTIVKMLKKHFPSDTVYTREPGGTPISEKIRTLLMDNRSKGMTPETEIALFCAARIQHMRELIIPALEKGKTVVSNRFDLSTIAYQVYGRQRPELRRLFSQMNQEAVGEYGPDIYIILDVKPEVGLARRMKGKEKLTRFDKEKLSFHERVRKGYLTLSKQISSAVIDTTDQYPRLVYEEVLSVLKHRKLISQKPV